MRVLTKTGHRHPVFVAFNPLARVSRLRCRRDVKKVSEAEHLSQRRRRDEQPTSDAHAGHFAPSHGLIGPRAAERPPGNGLK